MHFRRPHNIIFFKKLNTLIYSVLNDENFFYVLENQKIKKVKKIYKNSIASKIDDYLFAEYKIDKNYFTIRSLNKNKNKKVILNKNFKIKHILKNTNKILIFGNLKKKSYLIEILNKEKRLIKLSFDVDNFALCFFKKKLVAEEKKKSKI